MEYMTKRRVVVTKEDMILMLLNDDMDTPPEIHKFSPDAAKQLHAIGKLFFLFIALNLMILLRFPIDTGSTLMECYDEELHIVIVAWKGKTSVRAYVAKCDRIHYLRLCGADVSKFGKRFYNCNWSYFFVRSNNFFSFFLLKRQISLPKNVLLKMTWKKTMKITKLLTKWLWLRLRIQQRS